MHPSPVMRGMHWHIDLWQDVPPVRDKEATPMKKTRK